MLRRVRCERAGRRCDRAEGHRGGARGRRYGRRQTTRRGVTARLLPTREAAASVGTSRATRCRGSRRTAKGTDSRGTADGPDLAECHTAGPDIKRHKRRYKQTRRDD